MLNGHLHLVKENGDVKASITYKCAEFPRGVGALVTPGGLLGGAG